jgi:two-component system, NtrC family, response regulator HydG
MIKILIVDDDIDMCWVLSEVLKEEGYDTNIVHDKMSALSILSKQKYDIIILDYKIGDDDGLTILGQLIEKKQTGAVIMISAYGNNVIRKKALENGAFAFIDKPFDIVKFVRTIKKQIKLHPNTEEPMALKQS